MYLWGAALQVWVCGGNSQIQTWPHMTGYTQTRFFSYSYPSTVLCFASPPPSQVVSTSPPVSHPHPTSTPSLSQSNSLDILNPNIPISTTNSETPISTSPVPIPLPLLSTQCRQQFIHSSPSPTKSSPSSTFPFAPQTSVPSSQRHSKLSNHDQR